MAILRVSARWSGFPGAPGYSNFHFQASGTGVDVSASRALVHGFFDGVAADLPSSVSIDVLSQVEVLDDVSGQLVDYSDDPEELDPVSGGSSGNFSGPSGAVVNWRTATIVEGRRLRGRTFLVPLNNSAYEGDGTLTAAALTRLNNAASVLSGAGFGSGFGVLSRPAGGGAIRFGEVTGHNIPDMVAVLRSRRD